MVGPSAPWGWGFSAEPLVSLSPTGSAAAAVSRGRWSWPRRAPARWRQTSCLSFERDVREEGEKKKKKTRVRQAALFFAERSRGLTDLQRSPAQQGGGEEGLVFAGASDGAHQLRVGCQDAGALLRQVDPRHGGHVIDVIVIPGWGGEGSAPLVELGLREDVEVN